MRWGDPEVSVPCVLARRALLCPQVSPSEAKALIAGFADASGLQKDGIFINGEKYMFIKCEAGKEIIGKKVRARESGAERSGQLAQLRVGLRKLVALSWLR